MNPAPPGERQATGLSTSATALMGIAFFASGAAALVYQVSWQRILALHSGIGIYSIAMIVAAFMAGLGVGSALGSRLCVRLAPRRAVLVFAALEAGVGLFGAASTWLYYDLLYVRASWLYASPWTAGLSHFAALVMPTALMGMSLPLLARALVRDVAEAGHTLGFLYGINVLGASLGALATPWVLIRTSGIRGAVLTAAVANMVAAACALLLARRSGDAEAAEPAAGPPAEVGSGAAAPGVTPAVAGALGLWGVLYALSGFCALALEMLWFRLVDVAARATAFTFGTVLALYLFGLGAGSLAGGRLVGRWRRPLAAFLTLQCVLLLYSGMAVLLLARLPEQWPLVGWLSRLWTTRTHYREALPVVVMYFAFPLFLFGPPTFLMGFSFPVLQRAVQDDLRTLGRKVGLLQAANIAGCLAGSLVVGLVLLDRFGTTGSLRLVVSLGLVFALVVIVRERMVARFAALAVAVAVVLALLPDQRRLRLRGASSVERSLIAEDATGVAALVPAEDGWWMVWIHGKAFSQLPFGGMHTMLGAVPALVHPAPVDAAIVGLGSGDTAWAVGCRPETKRIRVWEIIGPNVRLLRALAAAPDAPDGLFGFLNDPRVEHHVADGRNALERSSERFDIIEIDALWPTNAYSGNVYSREFFSHCARRLKPGGLMSTWAPTPRVYASFAAAFSYVIAFEGGSLLVGSNEALPVARTEWRARLETAEVQGYLGARRSDEVRRVLRSGTHVVPSGRAEACVNTDLYPRDEFQARDPGCSGLTRPNPVRWRDLPRGRMGPPTSGTGNARE